MGNTVGPNGLAIGSSRQVSSSKYPKSYCMNVTSQMRSLTWVTLAGEDMTHIHVPVTEPDPTASGHEKVAIGLDRGIGCLSR